VERWGIENYIRENKIINKISILNTMKIQVLSVLLLLLLGVSTAAFAINEKPIPE